MLSVVLLAFYRTTVIFIMVFLGGLSLDALRVEDFGITPLFVFAAFLIIHLYERYFGSSDIAIIAFITLSATFIYTYVLSYSFINVIMTVLTLGVLFYLFQYLVKKGVL